MTDNNIFEKIERCVLNSSCSEEEKNEILKAFMEVKNRKVNIMVTGPTGAGKSSTINAMFGSDVARVGEDVDPETTEIVRYTLGNMIIWDTPGVGDGIEADRRHARAICDALRQTDDDGNAVIDLVLVVLEGSGRSMMASYELINQVIIPELGDNPEKRILVAINQADVAMKGHHWDYENNKPDEELVRFLDDKAESVKKRIYEATGVRIQPIYYSAGYKEPGMRQSIPYNLSKLLYYIVSSVPSEKRLFVSSNINRDCNMWTDDGMAEYIRETKRETEESVAEIFDTISKVVVGIAKVIKTVWPAIKEVLAFF